jgi:hypothetical protein
MPASPLNTSGQTRLDGAGNGTVRLGPNVGQRWTLLTAAIFIAGTIVSSPQCKIFMGGSATPDCLVDGTNTGELNSTTNVANFPLTAGQSIFAVWTGGDVGAIATLSIIGTVETGYKA